MSINQRIRELIEELTVKEILSKTDLGQSALYRARSGGGVSAETIEAICAAYNINAEWLVRGVGEKWKSNYEFSESINQNLTMNEQPPQYETEKNQNQNKDLQEQRYDLLLKEMEALRKRLELLEKEVRKKK